MKKANLLSMFILLMLMINICGNSQELSDKSIIKPSKLEIGTDGTITNVQTALASIITIKVRTSEINAEILSAGADSIGFQTPVTKKKEEPIQSIRFEPSEIQKVFPEIIIQDENGNLHVDYISMIPLLLKGLQEQKLIIDQLTARIESLESKLKK